MGLRINGQISSLLILRNLRKTDDLQQAVFERLSTGRRINRTADDPFGAVLARRFESQLQSLQQAVENTTTTSNLLDTTEATVKEAVDILRNIRTGIVSALNEGANGPGALEAEQAAVDQGLDALRRLAQTSRFNGIGLLDGSQTVQVTSAAPGAVLAVIPKFARFNPASETTRIVFGIQQVATQGTVSGLAVSGGPVSIRLTGPLGSAEIDLASGATSAEVASILDDYRDVTGIYGSGGSIFTERFGSRATISITKTGGAGSIAGLSSTGANARFSGTDAVLGGGALAVSLSASGGNGTVLPLFTGDGNRVYVNSANFVGTIVLNPATNQDSARGAGGSGAFVLEMRRSGFEFALDPDVDRARRRFLHLPDLGPEALGIESTVIGGRTFDGLLDSLQAGGSNALAVNGDNALRIVDEALSQILAHQSSIGSFAASQVEANRRAREDEITRIEESKSLLVDADMAKEASELARLQVLFQAGISVLGQSESLRQAALRLLE